MFRRLMTWLGAGGDGEGEKGVDLPSVERSRVGHLIRRERGFPHVDWGAAERWMELEAPAGRRDDLHRAIAAAWLDELRDSLSDDHCRWRSALVEGVGPVTDGLATRTSRCVERAARVIREAMTPIRGSRAIPPIAVIALQRAEDYYSFISPYYPEEGEWGTSGGVYINEGEDGFPMIVMPVQTKSSVERTIAHELTHHALRIMSLPIWVEEGLTQMMEERVTGSTDFRLDREMLARHRERWDTGGIERFLSGEAFHSAHDDEQELAYHLSQVIVRGLLSSRPEDFFCFARDCGNGESVEDAAVMHLGESPADLVGGMIGLGR